MPPSQLQEAGRQEAIGGRQAGRGRRGRQVGTGRRGRQAGGCVSESSKWCVAECRVCC